MAMFNPTRFAAMTAQVEAKRGARSPAETAELNHPRDIFAEVEREHAEDRALAMLGPPDEIQAFVDQNNEDMKTARRFSGSADVMQHLDKLVSAEQDRN